MSGKRPATVLEKNLDQVIDIDADEDTVTVVNASEPPAKRRRGPGKKNCKARIYLLHYIKQLIISSTTTRRDI
jgi:hypothetical protein